MRILLLGFMVFLSSIVVNCQNEKDTSSPALESRDLSMSLEPDEGEEILTLAGGCFWCTEEVYERIKKVNRVISGYAGGETQDPTYESVMTGETGHAEAVQIYYDPDKISLETLLEVFFLAAHDPTQVNRQGNDIGTQYRSIAFYRTATEKKIIKDYIQKLDESGQFDEAIATEVKPFEVFYPAEEFHQNYYPRNQNNPYIQKVSRPIVEKFEDMFPELSSESKNKQD